MNKLGICILVFLIAVSYIFSESIEENDLKILTIRWQRLVDGKGQTCKRCNLTEMELQKAIQSLEKSLAPLEISVVLEKIILDPEFCAKDISQSNRIWINEKALEDWLGATVNKSFCEFCCPEPGKEVECRTIMFEEKEYETVPAILIIKAGLLAASQILNVAEDDPCCPAKTPCEVPCSDSPEYESDIKKQK